MDDLIIDVIGRPATYGTRAEQAWRTAVASAAGTRDVPKETRFAISVEFRLPTPQRANEAWDLDNLIKPTLDALGGVIGWRHRRGPQEADDERIDRLVGSKRLATEGEQPGATIRVTPIFSLTA